MKNEKKEKNEKMKKMKKKRKKTTEKNVEKRKKNAKKLDSHAKSSTISFVTVVVVTFFVKILDDFHGFVSDCVSFHRKINNPFCWVTFFPKKSGNFHWT